MPLHGKYSQERVMQACVWIKRVFQGSYGRWGCFSDALRVANKEVEVCVGGSVDIGSNFYMPIGSCAHLST